MTKFEVARLPIRTALAMLAGGSLFLAGCSSSMNPVESISGVTPQVAKISGKIHGGNQPVSGATVTMYRAGQTSFASGAVAVAHTTSAADGYGSFLFQFSNSSSNSNSDNTYNCAPINSSSDPFLFLVARGGTTVNTPGATPNPDAAFIAPLGRCSAVNASTFVSMSEVVTVATMAAMHQFMNPSVSNGIENSVGSDGIFASDLALGNALYNVSNLVNVSTGYGNATLTKTGGANGAGGVSVTITPELAKINQLANAISSCINYSGSGNANCTSLYASAVPPASAGTTSVPGATMAPAADLLTALYYIFTNPTNGGTSNMQTIYNLSAGSGAPYQPTLSAMPTDWTIGVSFTSAATCTDITGSPAGFISSPSSLDVDRFGNLWIGNNQAGAGSLAGLDGFGAPLSCTTLTATNGGVANGSKSTAVDSNGNVYSGLTGSSDMFRYNPTTPATAPTHYTTPAPILAMAADGAGNVFFSTINGRLFEIANAASLTQLTYTQISSTLDSSGNATNLIVDAQGRIWASGNTGAATVTYPDTGSPTGYTTIPTPANLNSRSLSVGPNNNGSTVYYNADFNVAGIEYSAIPDSANGVAPTATSGAIYNGGGLTNPTGIAVDGAQNVWISNATGATVSGFSLAGTPLAPSGYVKDASYLGAEQAITVDASGNIWVAAGPNTITEIVGSAVPVVKSYAYALQNGRFQQVP